LQGKCGITGAPQFLQVAKDCLVKAWWLLRWSRPLLVLCFLGTPMNFSPEKFTLTEDQSNWPKSEGKFNKLSDI
jgi:hypothetical protein